MKKPGATTFAICVQNERYEASLELRKLYRVLPDPSSERHRLIRVIDESGEDYLYPQAFFLSIEVPKPVGKALLAAS